MGDADATIDGESCGQVLVEAVEPWPIRFVHQLGHSDYLWIKIQEWIAVNMEWEENWSWGVGATWGRQSGSEWRKERSEEKVDNDEKRDSGE